jgi:hypothetical protein
VPGAGARQRLEPVKPALKKFTGIYTCLGRAAREEMRGKDILMIDAVRLAVAAEQSAGGGVI